MTCPTDLTVSTAGNQPMDRTLINLASLLTGAVGLFAAITQFNVPDVNVTYWGENPFAMKRDAIAAVMAWLFAGVAILALLLQIWAEIFGADLPERMPGRQPHYYLNIALVGLVILGGSVYVLSEVGYRVARLSWEPRVIESYRGVIERADFVLEHDGLTPEHWAQRETIRKEEMQTFKQRNLADIGRSLELVEKLLEISSDGSLAERLARLKPWFDQ